MQVSVARWVLFFTVGLAAPALSADDIEAVRAAASEGEPAALFRLAEMHEAGEGVDANLALAAEYLRLAAERGYRPAQYRLGLMYAGGLGVPPNRTQAVGWLMIVTQKGVDDEPGLLAEALQAVLVAGLAPDRLAEAQAQVSAFAPVSGPANLPQPFPGVSASTAERMPTEAELRRLLPESECGPAVVTTADEGPRVVQYFAAGPPPALAKEAAADLDKVGIAVSFVPLDASLCAVRHLLGADPSRTGPAPEVGLRDEAGRPTMTFADGAYLVVELPLLERDRYVTVDYFTQDGHVVHLLPNGQDRDHRLSAGQRRVLGDPAQPGPSWQLGAPYGHDLLAVLFSAQPLYHGTRPDMESTADYLPVLRRRLTSTAPNDDIAIRYHVLEIVPRAD